MKLKGKKGELTPKGWEGKKVASVGKVWNLIVNAKKKRPRSNFSLKHHKDELNHLNIKSKDKIAKFAGIFYRGETL